jgi:PAS domain S-box-containing protein
MSTVILERDPRTPKRDTTLDFEDFFENGSICLHFVDADGVILHANKAELDLLGYSADEYVGRHIADFHADERAITDILCRLASGERLDRYPARLRAKDGSIKHVEVSSSVRFRDGKFVNTRCFSVDVTATVAAEAARREAEQRLAATYEKATVGIAEADREGRFLRVNPAFASLTGYAIEELVGTRFQDLTHSDDRRRDALLYRELVQGERDEYAIEKRYLRKDATVIDVELLSSAVRAADGSFDYSVRIVKDISARRQAEQRLQDSERRSRELLDALPMAVYTTDPAGKITYYNAAAAELAGRRPVVGEDEWCVSWKLFWPDGTPLPHDQCPMATAIRTGKELRGVEALLERPDGVRRSFTPFPTLLRDSQGDVIGAINVLMDITALKQADEEQRVLIDELNHRVKNTLATVQSISLHTYKSTPEAFVERFEERIIALSKAHDLLTRRRWSGVGLGELLDQEFAAYSDPADGRILMSGPELTLPARTGLALGMAIHELITNAAKYGSLSVEGGTVNLSWDVTDKDGTRHINLSWLESGGPSVEQPRRRGFGHRLIQRTIERDLRGDLTFKFEPSGLQASMRISLS